MTEIPQLLRDHYDDPFHRGECEAATHLAICVCEQTGCQVAIALRISGSEQVVEAWFDGSGCQWCEAIASLVVMACEGKPLHELQRSGRSAFLTEAGLEIAPLERSAACMWLPYQTLQQAIKSPVDATGDDLEHGPNFGGPSLREEC